MLNMRVLIFWGTKKLQLIFLSGLSNMKLLSNLPVSEIPTFVLLSSVLSTFFPRLLFKFHSNLVQFFNYELNDDNIMDFIVTHIMISSKFEFLSSIGFLFFCFLLNGMMKLKHHMMVIYLFIWFRSNMS